MRQPVFPTWVAWLLTALIVPAASAQAQEGPAPIAEPTPEHLMLKREVGTWEAKIRAYMGGPDAPPEVFEGIETNRMLGDYWILSEFEADSDGFPFHGHSQFGFDPREGRYLISWIDTMNPTMAILRGTYDPDSRTLTMLGKVFDQALGKEVEQKTVSTHIDDDHRTFALFMKAPEYGDDWVKWMEIDYSRRQGERTP